jgi:hypothetical protein
VRWQPCLSACLLARVGGSETRCASAVDVLIPPAAVLAAAVLVASAKSKSKVSHPASSLGQTNTAKRVTSAVSSLIHVASEGYDSPLMDFGLDSFEESELESSV